MPIGCLGLSIAAQWDSRQPLSPLATDRPSGGLHFVRRHKVCHNLPWYTSQTLSTKTQKNPADRLHIIQHPQCLWSFALWPPLLPQGPTHWIPQRQPRHSPRVGGSIPRSAFILLPSPVMSRLHMPIARCFRTRCLQWRQQSPNRDLVMKLSVW